MTEFALNERCADFRSGRIRALPNELSEQSAVRPAGSYAKLLYTLLTHK